MPHNRLDPFLNPKGIAVFGASESGTSVGSVVFSNLVAGGFAGPTVPINPKHKQVLGHTCYPSITDVPDEIDLVIVASPARTVPAIIRECGKKGARHAVILSAGFRESGGDGKALEAELLDAAHEAKLRFIGPNCVGLVRPAANVNATFLKATSPKGGLGVVSQSGALCSAITDLAAPHHLGFSALLSLGNSSDVDFGDALDLLANDPETKAILLYVEGIRDARTFISALRIAARVKPVIVLKSGRHVRSSQAASTHTGALIGSDDVFDAALERAGAVRVSSFGELFAAAEILSEATRAAGPRLGIVTNGGGAGVLAADAAGDLQIELAAPTEKTIEALNAVLPPFWSHANPVDILGDAGPDAYSAAVSACIADPNFDAVLVMLTPQAMTNPTAVAEAITKAVPKNNRKPILACWMGETSVDEGRQILSSNGIPDFATPEKAVEAFSYLAKHTRNRALAREVPGPRSDQATPDIDGARMIIGAAITEGRSMLSDTESKAVLRAFHIPTNTTIPADSANSAVVAAETLGFPVAMKISSPNISHKSDVGGVITKIRTAQEVKDAWNKIMQSVAAARPDAKIAGVTVESMASVADARELLVGASRDPVFGPTIVFGAGGTMVEVLRDSAVGLPPLNEVLARRQIAKTRVAKMLGAVRDHAPADVDKIIQVLLSLSDLVCEFPEIEELDINPLFAGSDAVICVDARIRVSRVPSSMKRYGHLAIAAYPRNLIQTVRLPAGELMTIRPIRPEDAEGTQSFVRVLSAEAKRMRYMMSLNELSPEMLARFTQIDYDREMALLGFVDEDGLPAQQGVARYIINPDGESCEFSIVVKDKTQHKGIGTALMHALMDAARQHNLKVIEGVVLAENVKMLQLISDLGFSQETDAEDRKIIHISREL